MKFNRVMRYRGKPTLKPLEKVDKKKPYKLKTFENFKTDGVKHCFFNTHCFMQESETIGDGESDGYCVFNAVA